MVLDPSPPPPKPAIPDSYHRKSYIPDFQHIEKLRILAGSLQYKFKSRFWLSLNLFRGIWVPGFGWFWGCSNFRGICQNQLATENEYRANVWEVSNKFSQIGSPLNFSIVGYLLNLLQKIRIELTFEKFPQILTTGKQSIGVFLEKLNVVGILESLLYSHFTEEIVYMSLGNCIYIYIESIYIHI